jgi:hypothetical protein
VLVSTLEKSRSLRGCGHTEQAIGTRAKPPGATADDVPRGAGLHVEIADELGHLVK